MISKLKKYRYEILIFLVEAVCMVLELVASRLLAPYFGSSQIVWTSVIAIILLSASIGNYFGGKIADGEDRQKHLRWILIIAALLTMLIPIIQEFIISSIVSSIFSIKIGAILATGALFLAPSIFLGMVPPIILKEKIIAVEEAGKTAGRVNAISTVGSIVGTILGGFFFVPYFGSLQVIFVLSAILFFLSFVPEGKRSVKEKIIIAIFVIVSIIGLTFYTHSNNSMEQRILNGEMDIKISYDTEYGKAVIYNTIYDGNRVRMLNIDSGYESATLIDEEDKYELPFDYLKEYDRIINTQDNIEDALMIGGAGYAYPKYYISNYLDKKMDVVEIDGKITELAKKYFFLNDLIDEYDINNTKRLELINDDGRIYLNQNTKKYDVILNDAFAGNVPAKVLTTKEANERIKDSLKENGFYMTNIIGSAEGKHSRFLKAEVNTLKQVFKYVYVVPISNDIFYDSTVNVNNIVVCSEREMSIDNIMDLKIDENEIIITDDYCPVDSLVEIEL